MVVSYVKAIERKTGKLVTLAEVGVLRPGLEKPKHLAAVNDAWEKFRDPGDEGKKLRHRFSEAILVLRGSKKGEMQFPDLVAAQASKEKDAARIAASNELRAAAARRRTADEAADAAAKDHDRSAKRARKLGLEFEAEPTEAEKLKAELDEAKARIAELEGQQEPTPSPSPPPESVGTQEAIGEGTPPT